MRYSVVISDRKVFFTLKGVYGNVTVDDYISVVLIDEKRRVVADEFIMPTKISEAVIHAEIKLGKFIDQILRPSRNNVQKKSKKKQVN